MLPFTVEIKIGVPPCDQLVDAVRKAVATGELRDEDAFPSVRALSRELHISPTTAHRAVGILKQDGLLASRPGIGMIVTAPNRPCLAEKLKLLQPATRRLVAEALDLGVSHSDLMRLTEECYEEQDETSSTQPEETQSNDSPDRD